MSRSLIFALLGRASAYEWKGIFYTPDDSYEWGAQKVDGAYADPSMKIALIPESSADEAALTRASGKGTSAMATTCSDVQSGGVITPAENTCYRLVFDQTGDSTFTVDSSSTTAIAFFAEHFPTEFERDAHYFKDTSGVDIEPVAQDPEPDADGHSHGHGGDSFESLCVCKAQANGWQLDCSDSAAIQTAVDNLDADTACQALNPSPSCETNYHVMQAHHDHCLHDQLPTAIEQKLHDYEQFYDDCFILRQYDPDLSACPAVDCTDQTAMTNAIAVLQASCTTAVACADATCADAIKTVLMAHDTCPESSLPNNLETALHDHEEPCEAQLCNTAAAAFDPYDESCGDDTGDGGADGSRGMSRFLIIISALPLALCLVLA